MKKKSSQNMPDKGGCVLVVDDDANLRQSLADFLTSHGYEVLTAGKGKQALQLVKRTPVDAALVDLRLGDISGLEMMRELKAHSPDCECILITGFASQESAIEELNLGVFAYFQKPYDMDQLLLALRRALEKREAAIRLRESEMRLRLALENSLIIIANVDRKLRYTWIYNPAPQFDPDTVIGKRDDELMDAQNARGILEIKRQVLETGQSVRSEFSISLEDGVHYYDFQATPYFDKDGQVAGMTTVGVDISAHKQAEQQLADTFEFQRVLMDLAARFVNVPVDETDRSINEALAIIGNFTGADRTYVFIFNQGKDTASNTHEWCAPGIDPMIDQLQDIPISAAPEYIAAHMKGESFLVPRVSDLPIKSSLRKLLEPQGIQTLASVPMMNEGECFGFVGFDCVTSERVWSQTEFDLLKVLATLLSNILMRQDHEKALQASEARFRAVIENLSDAFFAHDLEGNIIHVNKAACDLTGYTRQELLNTHIFEIDPDSQARDDRSKVWQRLTPGEVISFEVQHRRKDGSIYQADVNNNLMVFQDERIVLASVRDISERQKAEQVLRENEQKITSIFSSAPVGIGVLVERVFIEVNQLYCEMLGYTREELIGNSIRMLFPSEQIYEMIGKELYGQMEKEGVGEMEYTMVRKDGQLIDVLARVNPIDKEDPSKGVIFSAMDISERKAAEKALRESEGRFRWLFESAPVAYQILDQDGRITDINQRWSDLLGFSREETLGKDVFSFMAEDESKPARVSFHKKKNSTQVYFQDSICSYIAKDGRECVMRANDFYNRDADGRVVSVLITLTDITELRKAQQDVLLQSTALNAAANAVFITDQDGLVLWSNPAFTNLTGYTLEESLGRNPSELINSGLNPVEIYEDLWAAILAGDEWRGTLINRRKNGSLYTDEQTITPLKNEKGQITHFIGIKQDITERQLHERELMVLANISAALRTAETRVEMLPVLLDQLMEQLNIQGATLEMLDPATGDFIVELGRGIWEPVTGIRIPAGTALSAQVYESKQPYLNNQANLDKDLYRPDLFKDCRAAAGVPLLVREQIIGLLWVGSKRELDKRDLRLLTAVADMAANAIHRATLHEQTQERLHQLDALRTIEQTINSSLDLRVTFNVILKQASTLLGADALIVRLYQPHSLMLEEAASSGLRSDKSKLPAVRIGEGLAGRAALERRLVSLKDVDGQVQDVNDQAFFKNEGIQTYHAVPLIVKADIKGVLEVLHRTLFVPDEDWLDNLRALATQTAIAVDNHAMFDGLQRASVNMTLAIDETLEVWVQMLDSRADGLNTDTRLLLDLTIRLARAAGINDADSVHVARGALLHDIGKIGIPEAVLNKVEPLSKEEWELIHSHPNTAYDMLSSIKYLQPAMDVPYCHHERWDGSGYPRELKGEQIPLAARVFAVVDVYEALLSERPYRKAWTKEKALAHIRQNAGVLFDPHIVGLFMKIISDYHE